MSLETRARAAAEGLRAATTVNPEAGMPRLRHTHRQRRVARLATAALLVVGVAGGVALRLDDGPRVISPAHRENRDPGPVPRNGEVVSAADPGTTETRTTSDEPAATLPHEADLLQRDPHTEPLPTWSAFDQATGRFLWTDLPEDPDVTWSGSRTFMVSSLGEDSELEQISCPALCSGMLSFGPGPDEVTVLVVDLAKDTVNPGPESLALVYGIDGSRDEIDLAEVMGTDRHVLEETNDWAPPDGSEALISDIEWSPGGSRLAVSTHPGFFEPDCPSAPRPCEALIWIFDRDGGDPVVVHRQPAYSQDDGVLLPPLLTSLAWTSDGSRLGMVVMSDLQARVKRPPNLVALDVESGSASTLYEFSQCGNCRPPRYGFAWSPDGTRVAVTSGEGFSVLDSDGTVLSESSDGGPGPLAWLAKAR